MRMPVALGCLTMCGYFCVFGCMGLVVGDPHEYAYVTRKGDADSIGKWAIAQTDAERLYDGLGALRYKIGTTHNDQEVARATDWSLRIVAKIESWPSQQLLTAYSGNSITTAELLQKIFEHTSFDAYDDPKIEKLLYQLQPEERYSEWREEWQIAVSSLHRSRQKAVGKDKRQEP